MLSLLTLTIRSSKKRYRYGETIRLALDLENRSRKPLHVVRDWFGSTATGPHRIHAVLAVWPTSPNVNYYSFATPKLIPIAPLRTRRIGVTLGMPHQMG